jgi:dolichol-phosphate mannosyltransferase
VPTPRKVSIVVPVYNEALAIREVLRRVCRAPLVDDAEKEVVIIDDGSVDSTLEQITNFLIEDPGAAMCRLHVGAVTNGKGAALRAGFSVATGDVLIVQDGDLEYSPDDYPILLAPFADAHTHVVYGSRFADGRPRGMRLPNWVANRMLSFATRILFGYPISDEATGYKVFRREVLDRVALTCHGFEFCPEFTAKVLLAGFDIVEVPISYNPRGILDGKKIHARDGVIALWWLIKIRTTAWLDQVKRLWT